MTDKEAVLCALLEFEAALKGRHLPVVIVVGLPREGETVRVAQKMESPENRHMMRLCVEDLIATYEGGGQLGPKEGG